MDEQYGLWVAQAADRCRSIGTRDQIRDFTLGTTKRRTIKDMPRLNYEETVQVITRVPDRKIKALIAFMYLTGCRIDEVLKHKDRLSGLTLPPLMRYQIAVQDDINCILIRDMRTLKTRRMMKGKLIKRNLNKDTRRNVPLWIKGQEELVGLIGDYASTKELNEPLWRFGKRYAHECIVYYTGIYPHYFRHLRLTHLVQMHGYGSEQLRSWTGWATSLPASTYVHLDWKALLPKNP